MKNKLLLTILTFITALSISAVAIYYSVAGLAAIFAAAVIPIIIMGGILEIAKLVTTVWLHRYWSQARWWLKTYLTIAVVVLMFITSMGIFGFLSKAHIEQTSASQESVAQVERFDNEIKRQTALVERHETRIKQLESGGGGVDAGIQSQIDGEQRRIDSAYARIQPQIDEQNKIIEGQSKLFSDQITKIDSELALLQRYIDDKEVAKAQAMVGVSTDGSWGPGTARAVATWKTTKSAERTQLVTKIQDINKDNSNIQAARDEIKRLRATVDTQVAESNKTIARLRESLGKNKSEDIDSQLKEQMAGLKEAQTQLDEATKQKYALQTEYRKLEAEVGPVKYIAEFIYGEDADKNMLEQAVRWVIITIIFVFDPLAVLLLLASQYSFEYHKREKEEEQSNTPTDDELAMRIVPPEDTPGVTTRPFTEEEITALNQSIAGWDSQHAAWQRDHDAVMAEIKQSLYDKIATLEEQVSQVQKERDQLSSARNYEMERADTLATQLVEAQQSMSEPAPAEVVESEAPIEEPTVEAEPNTDTPLVDPDAIQTVGVTKEAQLFHPSEQYVTFNGKFMSMEALKSMRPDLILNANDPVNRIMFGSNFPDFAKSGDIYIRVDTMPNIVYKFNNTKWIRVDKEQNTSYLHYIPYVQYLINKIETGEYDTELLTDAERDEIEHHLKSK